jgi:uncharacterized protein YjfI (DUF2170 family)
MSLSIFDIHQQLAARHAGHDGVSIELIHGLTPAVMIELEEFGDLDIILAVSGEQIVVSTILVPAAQVKDVAGLDAACMRLNPINPLSNLGITTDADGNENYVVFGELSTNSGIDAIDEEIQALAANTIDAVEALRPYFD